MRFPPLLKKAELKNRQLCFPSSMTDAELVELMAFRAKFKLKTISLVPLVKLYKRGFYRTEIYKLFKSLGLQYRIARQE